MHQYSVGAPFERPAIDAAGPFPHSYQGNRYLVIAMDYYFATWLEAYAVPNQEASRVVLDEKPCIGSIRGLNLAVVKSTIVQLTSSV
jgi:hypothetical protein